MICRTIGILAVILVLLAHGNSASGQTPGFERISNDRLLAPVPADRVIEVLDGDTLWLGIHQIRLYGIDALEPKQPCIIEGESKSYCHLSATGLLEDFSARDDFRCEIHVQEGKDKPWVRYGRYVASCYVGDTDVSLELVKRGWAYADRYHGDEFMSAQAAAASSKLGLHRTDHDTPWDWRKAQRENTCSCE